MVTLRCAMWLMLASASPRKPYVPMEVRSSNALSFEVVNRSQRMGRSSRCRVSQTATRGFEMQAHINTVAVVGNLKQLETAILD